jgi:hypothetical protein
MNEPTQTISVLRHRMIEDMRMRKLSPKTQSHYIRAVRQLAKYLGRSPDTAIRVIQVLRGHKKLETTAMYAQVATDLLREVVSPLETLPSS